MGNLEALVSFIYRRSTAAAAAGQTAMLGVEKPKIFCAGNDFWKVAAEITGQAVHPPEYFEPQNYPRATEIPVGMPLKGGELSDTLRQARERDIEAIRAMRQQPTDNESPAQSITTTEGEQ